MGGKSNQKEHEKKYETKEARERKREAAQMLPDAVGYGTSKLPLVLLMVLLVTQFDQSVTVFALNCFCCRASWRSLGSGEKWRVDRV